MTTSAQMHADVKSRLGASIGGIALRYKNDKGNPMAGTAAGFGVVDIVMDPPEIIAFGGGRSANLQRTTGTLNIHWFTRKGTGIEDALGWGELACAVFRGLRLSEISYFAAQTGPTSDDTSEGNYNYVAVTSIDFHFDQAA